MSTELVFGTVYEFLCFPNMRIRNTVRFMTALTGMGILILVCAVFGWGLQYKLSLYEASSSQSTLIPHAKLLTQEQRPVSHRDGASSRPVSALPQLPIVFPLLCIAAWAMGLHLAAAMFMRISSTRDASRQQRSAHLYFFFFRPPPASHPSY
jgi:hypothetical protein